MLRRARAALFAALLLTTTTATAATADTTAAENVQSAAIQLTPTAWTKVHSGLPGDSFWNGGRDGAEAKVGSCPLDQCPVDRTGRRVPGVFRTFFQYDVSALAGKHILAAQLVAYETAAYSCQPRPVELFLTGPVNSGTTWNNQPAMLQHQGTQNVAYGRPGCPANSVGFQVNPAALSTGGLATLVLRSTFESDLWGWKKFDPAPVLQIQYNTVPNPPTEQTSDGQPCALVPNEPKTSSTTPSLRARISDPDGDPVRARFDWYRHSDGAFLGSRETPLQASGSFAEVRISVPAGTTIMWVVRATDGVDFGPLGRRCDLTVS